MRSEHRRQPAGGRLRAVGVLVLALVAPVLVATAPAAAAPAAVAPTVAPGAVAPAGTVRGGAALTGTADAAGPATATAAPAAGTGPAAVTPAYTYRTLNLTMQAQQASNWCWAASGNTVASYFGYSYSQNQFCNLAFDRSVNSSCPNSQATLGNDQEAFWHIGISTGNYVSGYLSGNTVVDEIDHDRPIITRIQWQSGGGHMMVLYGYDVSRDWLYWGDPWPSDNRYNYGDFDWYVSNSSFYWTHSLYGIGA
jgi:hypothetical protein